MARATSHQSRIGFTRRKTSLAVAMAKKEGAKITSKAGRAPSKYNQFMKVEIARLKAKNTAGLNNKEIFKQAALNWAHSPDNPKNKK